MATLNIEYFLKMFNLRLGCLWISAVLLAWPAFAQQESNPQNSEQGWQSLTPAEYFCMESLLEKSDMSIEQMINAEIGPDDEIIATKRKSCNDFVNRKMEKSTECRLNVDGRTFSTWCDESYSIRNSDGQATRIEGNDATRLWAEDEKIFIDRFERNDAKARRLEMSALKPFETQVPNPDWNCPAAKTPTAETICNSYALTILDTQFVEYSERLKSIDKNGQYKKKVEEFDQKSVACNGSKECIRNNLIQGIDRFAALLKTKGIQVKGYTEEMELKRKNEEALDKALEDAVQEENRKIAEAKRLEEEEKKNAEAAEAELTRQQKEKEEKIRKELEAYLAWKKDILATYKTTRALADVTFPPPFKETLNEVEAGINSETCGKIETSEQSIAAFQQIATTNNELVQRACILRIGVYESDAGNTQEGLSLFWKGLNGAKFSSGYAYPAFSSLMDAWISEDFVKREQVCDAMTKARPAYFEKPFRIRNGQSSVTIAPVVAASIAFNCNELNNGQVNLALQKQICSFKPPEQQLNEFSDGLKDTCWISTEDLDVLRQQTMTALSKVTQDKFDAKRVELAVAASSGDRRLYRERYELCTSALKSYEAGPVDRLTAAISQIETSCHEFF